MNDFLVVGGLVVVAMGLGLVAPPLVLVWVGLVALVIGYHRDRA